jgi:hypothetical protein
MDEKITTPDGHEVDASVFGAAASVQAVYDHGHRDGYRYGRRDGYVEAVAKLVSAFHRGFAANIAGELAEDEDLARLRRAIDGWTGRVLGEDDLPGMAEPS